jgi:ribosomal protein S1
MPIEPELRSLLRRALRSSRTPASEGDVSATPPADLGGSGARGAHTLEMRTGTVVGVDGRDVFVEFGPRFQGVLRLAEGEVAPSEGSKQRYTLRGTEEGLWRLERPGVLPLATWREIRVGDLVEARVLAPHPFGLELRAGELHAFMPFSQLGLGRRVQARALVGHRMVCEVLAVEAHRQRIILSRRLAKSRERERGLDRSDLSPGRIVSGRVAKIVPYGVFVDLGPRLRGLVHISNLAHGRVRDPGEHVEVGATIEVLVLRIDRGGRRVSLGLKQLLTDPLDALDARCEVNPVVLARAQERTPKGQWFDLPGGVRALADRDGLAPLEPGCRELRTGATVPLRVIHIDVALRRVNVCVRHEDGRLLQLEDTLTIASDEADESGVHDARLAGLIGKALRMGGGFERS